MILNSHFDLREVEPEAFVDPSGHAAVPTDGGFSHSFNKELMQSGQINYRDYVQMRDINTSMPSFESVALGSLKATSLPMAGAIALSIGINAAPAAGVWMALNPMKASMMSGFAQGVIDQGFNLRTGFPNLDPLGAASEELGKFLTDEFQNTFKDSNTDFDIDNNEFWKSNPYD